MRRLVILLLVVLVVGGVVTVLVVRWAEHESKAVLVPLDEVPEPFLRTAREKLPEVKFDHARRLPNGNYEIRGKTINGKVREVELAPSGEVVEIE